MALVGCKPSDSTPELAVSQATRPDAAMTTAMNRAIGEMGRFEFDRAGKEFAAITALPSAPLEAELGRAIATLNQSQEGAQDEALVQLGAFLAKNPSKDLALRARYCQGLCLLYLGRAGEAVAAFVPVAEARGGDAYAQYFAGQSLEQVGETAKALEWYERAVDRDPMLKSALLGVQRCARRLGDDGKAERALANFEELARNPRARNAEFKYTRMGDLGLAPLPRNATADTYAPPTGPIFADECELPIRWPAEFVPVWSTDIEQHAVTADLNDDGRLDIVIARGLAVAEESRALVLLGRDDGAFDAVPDHPLADLVGGATWSLLMGDINADGRVDLYACRSGGNRLILATAEGGFRDATEEWGAAGKTQVCVDGALADLDHDGDLDLMLLARDGANELLANNGDGTFRSIGAEAGVATEGRLPISVIVGDFDYDRDADIFILNDMPPNELLLNDRLWRWRAGTLPGFTEQQLNERAAAAAVIDIADIPLRRLVLVTTSYLRMPTRVEKVSPDPRMEMSIADFTGDGHQDLLLTKSRSIALHDEAGHHVIDFPTAERVVRTQALMLQPMRGASLLSLRSGAAPLVRGPGAGRGPFAAVSFSGRDDPSQSMRSNTSGIGTGFAARIGSEWFGGETFRGHSGRGQSLAPVAIGTGPFEAIDVLEIDWSDGVFQSELALAKDALHQIIETQRQISSCPVVFAWNGSELRFVTDVLGVGGLGYLLEPGVYSEPRPWEFLVLPEGALVPKSDGSLALALAEPMEESCMLDRVRLRAVDIPEGWDIAPDERLAISGTPPTGELVAWRESWLPRENPVLAHADLAAQEPGAVDPRFIGRLAGEQVIEVEFGTAIDAISDPWLVIDGWVEYPYCQTMFGAWQAGAKYRAPNLEARAADGSWKEVVSEWGYPAGMPRRMALPIPKAALPPGTTALRMRTTMEVYFDSVRLVARESLPAQPVECMLSRATLASVGFAKRTTGLQKQPFYDRTQRTPLWDCRFQHGLYTEFGDVRELLAEQGDALIVFGPGEEVALDFASPTLAPANGSTRRYVLETRGWCKDMDLFTRDGETIDPLPGPAAELSAPSRTRPMGGR